MSTLSGAEGRQKKRACRGGFQPFRTLSLVFSVYATALLASFGDLLEPLQHAQHDEHGDEANGQEDAPALPDRHFVIHQRANPKEEVAHSRGA